MVETMNAARGVGLAAQQVSQPLQLTVLDVTKSEDRPSNMWIDGKPVELADWMPMVLLNPELTLGKERETGLEGCPEFPGIPVPAISTARRQSPRRGNCSTGAKSPSTPRACSRGHCSTRLITSTASSSSTA